MIFLTNSQVQFDEVDALKTCKFEQELEFRYSDVSTFSITNAPKPNDVHFLLNLILCEMRDSRS